MSGSNNTLRVTESPCLLRIDGFVSNLCHGLRLLTGIREDSPAAWRRTWTPQNALLGFAHLRQALLDLRIARTSSCELFWTKCEGHQAQCVLCDDAGEYLSCLQHGGVLLVQRPTNRTNPPRDRSEDFIELGIFPRYARELVGIEGRLSRKLSPAEARAVAVLLQIQERTS